MKPPKPIKYLAKSSVFGAGLLTLILLQASPAWGYGISPAERYRPSGIDLLESSLYWMQDLTGTDNLRDPAVIVALMEDQAARFFDFSAIAWQVGGPRYAQMNILERSHFQNRLRDILFERIARRMGIFNNRIPRFRPIMPVQTGPDTIAAGGYFFHPGGPDFQLLFRFHLTSNGWRIYDVDSNGVSAVAALRRSMMGW
ncbi:MAG: ABC transporter substrate-binding protein [Proteobacteria bacterium]|jgi:hypothetical protein|nr:ABC transporter substrate-binding protein [Pseudomonadota bacterium]MCG6935967.1 ABC transporter substrate-binding protein [Pseudomonadota bacterium]